MAEIIASPYFITAPFFIVAFSRPSVGPGGRGP